MTTCGPMPSWRTAPSRSNDDEVCRGRLHKADQNGYTRKSFDILSAFLDVLGQAGQPGAG